LACWFLGQIWRERGGKGRIGMAQSLPFHSVKRGAPQVFHTNDACDEGLRVEQANWRGGDGGLPLCRECARRNKGERLSQEQLAFRHRSA
jgi:hypothetical protein